MQGRTEGPGLESVSSKQRELQHRRKMRTAKTGCPAMTFLLRTTFSPGSGIKSHMPSIIPPFSCSSVSRYRAVSECPCTLLKPVQQCLPWSNY